MDRLTLTGRSALTIYALIAVFYFPAVSGFVPNLLHAGGYFGVCQSLPGLTPSGSSTSHYRTAGSSTACGWPATSLDFRPRNPLFALEMVNSGSKRGDGAPSRGDSKASRGGRGGSSRGASQNSPDSPRGRGGFPCPLAQPHGVSVLTEVVPLLGGRGRRRGGSGTVVKSSVPSTVSEYNQEISRLGKEGNWMAALKLLSDMQPAGFPPNVVHSPSQTEMTRRNTPLHTVH